MGNKNDGRNLSRAFLKRQEEEKVRQEIEQEKGEIRRQRKIGHGARVGLGVTVVGVLIATPIVLSAMAGEGLRLTPTVMEATDIVADDSETVEQEYPYVPDEPGTPMTTEGRNGMLSGTSNLAEATRQGYQVIDAGNMHYVYVMRDGVMERVLVDADGNPVPVAPSDDTQDTGAPNADKEASGQDAPQSWQDAVSAGLIPEGDYDNGCYIFPYNEQLALVILDGSLRYVDIDRGVGAESQIEDLYDAQRQGFIPEGDYSSGYHIFLRDGTTNPKSYIIITNGYMQTIEGKTKGTSLGTDSETEDIQEALRQGYQQYDNDGNGNPLPSQSEQSEDVMTEDEMEAAESESSEDAAVEDTSDAITQGFQRVSRGDLTYADDAPHRSNVTPMGGEDNQPESAGFAQSGNPNTSGAPKNLVLPAQEIAASDTQVYVKQSVNIGARLTKGDGKLVYSSSNTNIATVDANGRVLAGDKPGSVTITVKASQTNSFAETEKQVTVTIRDKDRPVITVTPSVNLVVDEAWLPDAKVEGGKASKLTYKSSNTAVAQMMAGQVMAVGAGTADITVTLPESATTREVTATVRVTVSKVQPTITINNNISLIGGQATAEWANAKVKNGSKSDLRLTSSSPSVASIVNNCIVAGNPGTATVTFTLPETNKTTMATRKVTVTVSKGQATLTVPSTVMTLSVNQRSAANAGATVSGADASAITLTSSNLNVVRIDANKRILAVSPGTAMVTVRVPDTKATTGARKTLQVTVTKLSNTMTVSRTKKTTYASKLRSKAVTVTSLSVKNAKGTVSYGKVSGSSCLTVNTKTGKVTVKKGTKKGTYTANVRIRANGNSTYKSKAITTNITVVVK